MKYEVVITISLKEGMLNPEAEAIQRAIAHLGFGVDHLRKRDQYRITLDAVDKQEAEKIAGSICERLLANPVIHTYTIEVI